MDQGKPAAVYSDLTWTKSACHNRPVSAIPVLYVAQSGKEEYMGKAWCCSACWRPIHIRWQGWVAPDARRLMGRATYRRSFAHHMERGPDGAYRPWSGEDSVFSTKAILAKAPQPEPEAVPARRGEEEDDDGVELF